MADITMCNGVGDKDGRVAVCEVRGRCWRHEAPASTFRQSYFAKAPLVYEDGKQKCAHFCDMND